MHRGDLERYLNELLACERFRDYCPNGLQVEGRQVVSRVVTGVTASRDLIDAALQRMADAIIVHHGYFWKGEDGRVTGIRRTRLKMLLGNDVSLFAYHLPLDAHETLGNNAQLALRMGWRPDARFGDQEIGFAGSCPGEPLAGNLARLIGERLGREAQLVGDPARRVARIAWCTGAAQGYFEQAIAAGADCYVSGEISEQTVHLARESGIPYIASGHHATERFGVQALARHLSDSLGLQCEFVDIDNPV